MPDILFATGALMNLLERATVENQSGFPESDFPLSNLWDGRPNKPLRFSEPLSAASQFLIDLNGLGDTPDAVSGTFEAFPFTGWTAQATGTGTVTQTTAAGEFHGGVAAAKLTGGSFGVRFYRDIPVRADETRKLAVWLKGGGGAASVIIEVQDKKTGRYLTSGGTWQSTQTALFSQTSATYTEHTVTYTTESLYRVGEGVTELRMMARTEGGNTVFIDDFSDWPGVDLLSFHGLSVPDQDLITWTTSNDGVTFGEAVSAGDWETGFDVDQKPNLYLRRASRNMKRYHFVILTTNITAPFESREIGEMVLCQIDSLERKWDWGFEVKLLEEQTTNNGQDGSQQTYTMARWPRHILAVDGQYVTDAQMRQTRDELWGRARGALYPILLIPNSDENLVMLVHTTDAWSVRRRFTSNWIENAMLFAEMPFASTAIG